MAFADDDLPLTTADLDSHPIGEPPIARRYRGDAAPVAVLAFAEQLDRRIVEPGATREIAAQRRKILGDAAHHARGEPFLLRNPQRGLPALGQPAGQAYMVRVV